MSGQHSNWLRLDSLYGFFAHLRAVEAKLASEYRENTDPGLIRDFMEMLGTGGGDGVIYGAGGYSRYTVLATGEMTLLAWSVEALPKKAEAATAQGIRITGKPKRSLSPGL